MFIGVAGGIGGGQQPAWGGTEIVSGYVCNHGSPNGERDTASPRGRYGERLSVTRV